MAASWKKIRGTLRPSNLKRYLFDPGQAWLAMIALFIAESVVNIVVIHKIKCELLKA